MTTAPEAGSAAQALTVPPARTSGPQIVCTIPEGAKKPSCGIVWMHGLGDTEHGWSSITEELNLPKKLGACRYVLPRAPVQHVTCNGEKDTSWFDMADLPIGAKSTGPCKPPRYGCSLDEALKSCARIHGAIKSLEEQGVPPERIVVGGFSQGGAMSLLAGMTYPSKLAGIVVFSGILFYGDKLSELMQPHCAGMEVFWGHGRADNVLHPSLQDEGVKLLEEAGFKVTAKKYGVPHSASDAEFEDTTAFVSNVIGASN